jgi:hypothetical protein
LTQKSVVFGVVYSLYHPKKSAIFTIVCSLSHPQKSGILNAVEGPAFVFALAVACPLPSSLKTRHFDRSVSRFCELRSGETRLSTKPSPSHYAFVLSPLSINGHHHRSHLDFD